MSSFYDKDKRVTLSGNAPAPGMEDAPAPQPIKPNGQHGDYWVLSEDEIKKGFVRPVRESYVHRKCGTTTIMSTRIAETYARDPKFYGATFCCNCGSHYALFDPQTGEAQFYWKGTTEGVGS